MSLNKILEKHHFETGDILLFSYAGSSCIDKLIKTFTQSSFTHVGMIIHNPPWRKDLKGYYLLQSNREAYYIDSEDHEKKVGVELTKLDDSLNYNGKIHWRHIKTDRNEDFYKKLTEAHSKVHNRPYDMDLLDWIKAGLKIKEGDTQKVTTFWCSALVSFLLVELNLLENDTDWTLVTPADLSSTKDALKFINCDITKDILIN